MSTRARLPFELAFLRLRRLREDDLAAFHRYRSDPQVARYQGWWPMNEAKALAFLREQGARAGLERSSWVQLAIADVGTDALLGDLGIWTSHDRRDAELGITVTPSAQGRGVGRTAMTAACTWLFQDPEVTRIRAYADARNVPCRRMLIAAGFREVGFAEVFVKEEHCVEHQYLAERTPGAP